MEKNLINIMIIAATILLSAIFIYCSIERQIKAIKAKIAEKRAANANSNNKEQSPDFLIVETTKEKVLALFNEMSVQEIDKNKEGIEKYLFKNFAFNLKVYNEGISLINDQIESTQKREMIKKILDDIIYKKARIPFLTKNGYTTASSFKSMEPYWELESSRFDVLKKEVYNN